MTRVSGKQMKVIGRGSEATVYLDADSNRAIKHFDRAPVRTARGKARAEYEKLCKARDLSRKSAWVRVPEPGMMSHDVPAFSMERIEGASLLDRLACGKLHGEEAAQLAVHVAHGMRLFKDILADCTLDHVHPSPEGAVIFFDFGNGSEDENGWEPAGLLAMYEDLAGSTLYECSRPARYRGLTELDEIARFLGIIARELGISWSYRLERRIWHAFAGRGLEGSFPRFLWYRMAGAYNARRMFRTLRSSVDGPITTAPDTVFSFVWDFPSHESDITNGVHKVVDGLMSSMGKMGVESVILTLGEKRATHHRVNHTVEVYPRQGLRIPHELVERVRTEGNSAVTILNGTFNTWNTRLAQVLARHDINYVVSPHTIMDKGFFSVSRLKKWAYWALVERKMLNNAAAIVSFDKGYQEELVERGVSTPCIQSWNGICDPVLPEEDRFSENGPVQFHFFGRIDTRTKGLDMLLEATAMVAVKDELHVTIQGPGTAELPELKRMVKALSLEKRIRFKPPATTPNPILIMSEYDVCILPSRYEGFPTALVEAMMAARPIVTTRTGSLAPILEAEGIGIVVDTCSEAIAAGMQRAIRQRGTWRTQGLKGREWAISHLQWDDIASNLLEDLQQTLYTATK